MNFMSSQQCQPSQASFYSFSSLQWHSVLIAILLLACSVGKSVQRSVDYTEMGRRRDVLEPLSGITRVSQVIMIDSGDILVAEGLIFRFGVGFCSSRLFPSTLLA